MNGVTIIGDYRVQKRQLIVVMQLSLMLGCFESRQFNNRFTYEGIFGKEKGVTDVSTIIGGFQAFSLYFM